MKGEKAINTSPVDRSLIKIIDDANYSGYGKAVTAEIERLQTKIAALEAVVVELRKKNYELSGKAGFLSGVIQGVTHWNIPPELKTILHGELFKMTTALNSTKGEK